MTENLLSIKVNRCAYITEKLKGSVASGIARFSDSNCIKRILSLPFVLLSSVLSSLLGILSTRIW